MHPTVEEFRTQAEERYGFSVNAHEFDDGTRTATDAAAAVDCDLAQIVKSIVMSVDDQTVLALTSGKHRVDETKLAAEFGVETDRVRTANADEVKSTTGWSIGGVPPFCHRTELPILADPTFQSCDELWGAAGTPDAMFPLGPERLVEFVDPRFVDVYG